MYHYNRVVLFFYQNILTRQEHFYFTGEVTSSLDISVKLGRQQFIFYDVIFPINSFIHLCKNKFTFSIIK